MKNKDETIRELKHKLALAEMDAKHWKEMYEVAKDSKKFAWTQVEFWQQQTAFWSEMSNK